MTAATQTLTDFILAQIEEDEAHADRVARDLSARWAAMAPRLSAECEAKRRILELHCGYSGGGSLMLCNECGGDTGSSLWPCETLATLASIYADREGFREEWRL